MRHAIAIWNYCWDPAGLPAWIHAFADHGFDAVSFHPDPFADGPTAEVEAAARAVRERGMVATVHGACGMSRRGAERIADALRDRLIVFSIDAAWRDGPQGPEVDARRTAIGLAEARRLAAPVGAWVAVEDFPLDAAALIRARSEAGDGWDQPRTGILLDIGHLHLRRSGDPRFAGVSVADYVAGPALPLVEVHLHDNHGERDEHGHLGHGNVPFDEVAAALRAVGFDGVSTIEIAPSFHGSTPEASRERAIESVAAWRALLRPRPTA